MNLFPLDYPITLSEKDGLLRYFGPIFSPSTQCSFFERLLLSIQWEQEKVTLYGKSHLLNRKTALYAKQKRTYTYSGETKHTKEWTPLLETIENELSRHIQANFNTCLLNYYPNGSDKMGFHSDNEPEIVPCSTIASLSFGAERYFDVKHTSELIQHRILLENGSLLTMENEFQQYWKHQLPQMKTVTQPRINLTFRLLHYPLLLQRVIG